MRASILQHPTVHTKFKQGKMDKKNEMLPMLLLHTKTILLDISFLEIQIWQDIQLTNGKLTVQMHQTHSTKEFKVEEV